MQPMRFVFPAALGGMFLLTGCALHGQAHDSAALLEGQWTLDKSFGVTPPQHWSMKIATARDQVTIRSHWEEPKDGRYGLTLMGLAMPEFVLDTTGRQTAAQVGPFVFQCESGWEGGKLVTHWSTSEFMGSSFQGTWTRAVSKDRSMQTLDVDALSSGGEVSRARLIFRRG